MAEKINHWCAVCGKGYYACDSCNSTKTFTPWRSLTDSIDHFKVFLILKDYNNKFISKEDAKKQLSYFDLSDRESFKDGSKKLLDEIFTDDIKEDIEVAESNNVNGVKQQHQKKNNNFSKTNSNKVPEIK